MHGVNGVKFLKDGLQPQGPPGLTLGLAAPRWSYPVHISGFIPGCPSLGGKGGTGKPVKAGVVLLERGRGLALGVAKRVEGGGWTWGTVWRSARQDLVMGCV